MVSLLQVGAEGSEKMAELIRKYSGPFQMQASPTLSQLFTMFLKLGNPTCLIPGLNIHIFSNLAPRQGKLSSHSTGGENSD